VRDLLDRPGLLRKGDELARLDEAARRVLPTHQRLDADGAAVAQGQLGLQPHLKVVAGRGRAQLGQQAQVRQTRGFLRCCFRAILRPKRRTGGRCGAGCGF
jgi:hypothetical protein